MGLVHGVIRLTVAGGEVTGHHPSSEVGRSTSHLFKWQFPV